MKKIRKSMIIIGLYTVSSICLFLSFTTDIKGSNQLHNSVIQESQDTYISKEIQGYCEQIGAEYNICPELLEAIIERESSGKSTVSNGSCYGLMQINIPYHTDRANRLGVNIRSEYGNIMVGADFLAELFEENEDASWVLMKYNGYSKADTLYEQGRMSSYAQRILERSEELERAHGK